MNPLAIHQNLRGHGQVARARSYSPAAAAKCSAAPSSPPMI